MLSKDDRNELAALIKEYLNFPISSVLPGSKSKSLQSRSLWLIQWFPNPANTPKEIMEYQKCGWLRKLLWRLFTDSSISDKCEAFHGKVALDYLLDSKSDENALLDGLANFVKALNWFSSLKWKLKKMINRIIQFAKHPLANTFHISQDFAFNCYDKLLNLLHKSTDASKEITLGKDSSEQSAVPDESTRLVATEPIPPDEEKSTEEAVDSKKVFTIPDRLREHCDRLGLGLQFTFATLKAKRNELLKKIHPDKSHLQETNHACQEMLQSYGKLLAYIKGSESLSDFLTATIAQWERDHQETMDLMRDHIKKQEALMQHLDEYAQHQDEYAQHQSEYAQRQSEHIQHCNVALPVIKKTVAELKIAHAQIGKSVEKLTTSLAQNQARLEKLERARSEIEPLRINNDEDEATADKTKMEAIL